MKKFILLFYFLFFSYNNCYCNDDIPTENTNSIKDEAKENIIKKLEDKDLKQETENNVNENQEQKTENVIESEITENTTDKPTDKSTDKTTENIKNNILLKEESKTITPFQDEFYTIFKSFMFSNSNIKVIKKALLLSKDKNSFVNSTDEYSEKETNEDGTTEEAQEEEVFDGNIGNIYLRAILYISKNFWTVWINDKKISNFDNLSNDNEYYIKKLDINEATIVLKVSRSKWNYINASGTIGYDRYTFNNNTNKVEFELKLHPNQTFVSSKDIIVDGVYKGEVEKLLNDVVEDTDLDLFLNDEFDFDSLE